MHSVFKIHKARAGGWMLSPPEGYRQKRGEISTTGWVDTYSNLCARGTVECRQAAPSMLLIYNEAGAVQRAIGSLNALVGLTALDDVGGGVGFSLGVEEGPAAFASMVIGGHLPAGLNFPVLEALFLLIDFWCPKARKLPHVQIFSGFLENVAPIWHFMIFYTSNRVIRAYSNPAPATNFVGCPSESEISPRFEPWFTAYRASEA